jgi:hypothetical protein
MGENNNIPKRKHRERLRDAGNERGARLLARHDPILSCDAGTDGRLSACAAQPGRERDFNAGAGNAEGAKPREARVPSPGTGFFEIEMESRPTGFKIVGSSLRRFGSKVPDPVPPERKAAPWASFDTTPAHVARGA